ncbi:hypothetical protein PGT21_011477 [Puccinia graminis f. sp. tritici]|nr:hypothetical protein PGT21_011477 [Puccinia graminis f. sp. tritici]
MRAKAILSRLRPPTTHHHRLKNHHHQPTQPPTSSSHPSRFNSTCSHSPPLPPPPAQSLSTQLKSLFITDQLQSDPQDQEQPSNHQSSTRLLSNQTTPSSIDLAYLKELSESLNSDSYHQLSSPAFSQILNHLHSNDLFKYLSPGSFDLLLDFNPEGEEKQSIQSTHYYLYHRIIFLLDRIYEHKELFTQHDLDRFHSISLKRLAHVGLFRAAELIWDQLISPSATDRQDDQILMLDCIRTAFLNHQSSSQAHQQNHIDHTTAHDNQEYHRELLPLSSKDFKRMINLTESIGKSLLTSTTNRMDRVTERWTVRTVAEIFGIQGERTRLADWLSKQRSLDLDFPDNGASWSDPKLTAIVVRMFKDQGQLEKMIMIYEAALHPSSSMLAHPGSSFGQIFEDSLEPATLKTLPDEKHFISNRRSKEQDENSRMGRKRNAILTRTYHDLISACAQANRPHLALHYLSEAVAENEAYVERLPEDHTIEPPVPHLRLQPATYAELIPSLVKKKRDTQLRKVHELSERLVRTTVAELQWIRLRAAAKADRLAEDPQKDSSPWGLVLAAIVPHLSGHPQTDLEASKSQNLALEKAVFTHANQPALDAAPRSRTPTPDLTRQPEHHIAFIRNLERATFLSKSLAHSVLLLHRLTHLIDKTRINRDIRFQHHLLKKKKNNNKALSSVHSRAPNLPRPPLNHHHHLPSSSQSSAQSSANQIRTLERIDALIDKKRSLRFANPSSSSSSPSNSN